MSRLGLATEFAALFLVLPLAYRFAPVRFPALPLLWVVTAYACFRLARDPQFDRVKLWNGSSLPGQLASIVAVFALAALLIWVGVYRFAPELEWSLMKRAPVFWGVVMILYPVLSVYPQGLIYRAFFFERYGTLISGKWAMILASAAAFALMHIIFRNWLAVALTFGGGLLFAWRYAETGSLATSSFEHALYGCWLFTVGLGQYFYHGTIATMGSAMRQ